MSLLPLIHLRSWPAARRAKAVTRDADALLREWGHGAYDRAAALSREEDFGFRRSPVAGHWGRVQREIARRLGRQDAEPRHEAAA